MADSTIPINETIEAEGLYSNNANDSGKETVLGLTRVADPDWSGWHIVDDQKKKPNFPHNLEDVKSVLLVLARPYYKKKYWDPIRADEIQNQEEAKRIYDMYVNKGSEAIILAQRTLGIAESGHMDNITLNTLNNQA